MVGNEGVTAKARPRTLVFNGVHGATGAYLRPPVRLAGEPESPRNRWRWAIAGVDVRRLEEAGWGVIFGSGVDAEVREALAPLLARRRGQAGAHYREWELQSGDSAIAFLDREASRYGPADPSRLPFYLLIVGGAATIPYEFQYRLDVQHAVGRLWFDSAEEYAAYARGVVAAEQRPAAPERTAVLFAPQHPDDPMTALSAEQLARPLARKLAHKVNGWTLGVRWGDDAGKGHLARLLGGDQTPALLFTAGHGIGFFDGDERQGELQGALLCQGWPGPRAATISAEHYFAAADVAADACLQGLISFHFACYSAGTPRWDSFFHLDKRKRQALASQAFVARLPQRLLGHPRGGALAVIGHVDQAFPCSFFAEETGAQLQTFASALIYLMQGYPVGAAMECFNQRYAEIATEISARMEPVAGGERAEDQDLFKLWLAHNDARGYVILGDPAVRLGGGAAAASAVPAGAGAPVWRGV